MNIRLATKTDLAAIMPIFDKARAFMAASGNSRQWINGYPQQELIEKEIESGHCYVCTDETQRVVATFCFIKGPDPTYTLIEKGSWRNDKPYYVIHRLASDGSHKGIARLCINWCFTQHSWSFALIRTKITILCSICWNKTDSNAVESFM